MQTATDADGGRVPKVDKDKCLFDIYKKEADDFYVRRKYKKAMDSYSLALSHKKHDVATLVARSRCYLNMGLSQHALADVERALDIEASNSTALYQKGQVLYRLGHYEMSLTFFNKGRKMNPDAPGFQEGMERAEKAITVGRRMKMTEVGDLSLYIPRRPNFTRRYQTLSRKSSQATTTTTATDRDRLANALTTTNTHEPPPPSPGFRTRQMCKLVTIELQKKGPVTLDASSQDISAYLTPRDLEGVKGQGQGQGQGHQHRRKRSRSSKSIPDSSAVHHVLSQLYADKTYFEKILRDLQDSDRFNEDVFHMAGDGLAFVAERMLFWAEFGARAPTPAADPSRRRRQSKQRPSIKPYKSARGVSETSLTSNKADGSMTSSFSARPADDDDEETWVQLNEISEGNVAAQAEQEIDLRRRRKSRGSRSQRGSVTSRKKIKKRRRRKRRATEGDLAHDDDLTSMTAEEAAKLKFSFQSNRQEAARQSVPTLVFTEDTGETETEWDETDIERDSDSEAESTGELTTRSEMSRHQLYDDWLYQQPEQEVKKEDDDPIKLFLIRATREITQDLENEEFLLVRERVHSILGDLDKYKPEFMADKMGLVATLHSLLGNAYLEIRDLDLALKHHKEDLRIGKERDFPNITSRALANLGRAYVFRREYVKALDCFAQKSRLQSNSTPMESAWLYHEIANCFLQLQLYEFSRDAAASALESATAANSGVYQLQAAVLLAVSEGQC